MLNLTTCMNRACGEAPSAIKRGRDSSVGPASLLVSHSPVPLRACSSDAGSCPSSPQGCAHHSDCNVAGVPAATLEPRRLRVTEYSAPLASAVGPMFPNQPRSIQLALLPLPRFAGPTADLSSAPGRPQPDVLVTQMHPSSPGPSRRPPYDLLEFGSTDSSVSRVRRTERPANLNQRKT